MKLSIPAFFLMLLALLSGCARPLPQDRQQYVGHWRGPGVDLHIHADGRLAYKRTQGSSSTSIDAPIQKFEGDDFIVGVGPIGTRFDVSRAPHEVDGVWTMTVDGVELFRTGETDEKSPKSDGNLIST